MTASRTSPAADDPFDAAAIRDIVFAGFPDLELLDLTGPYEVLSSAVRCLDEDARPRVRLAAPTREAFTTRNGLRLQPVTTLADAGAVDLLVVPGGRGVRTLLEEPRGPDGRRTLDDVGALAERARAVLSVCTGALLLAELGLLDGRDATTHHLSLDRLRELAPTARVHADRRWVEDGRFVISAGVSSGIDAALHVTERLWGGEVAARVAGNIEYAWEPGDAG